MSLCQAGHGREVLGTDFAVLGYSTFRERYVVG